MGVRGYFEIYDFAIKVWCSPGSNVNLLERVLHFVGKDEVEWHCESKPLKFHPKAEQNRHFRVTSDMLSL